MLKSGFYITAELKIINAKKIDETIKSLNKLYEQTIQESGCSLFQLHHCLDEPTRLLLWERYDSKEDYNYHFEQDYTKEYLALQLTEIVQYFKSDIVTSN